MACCNDLHPVKDTNDWNNMAGCHRYHDEQPLLDPALVALSMTPRDSSALPMQSFATDPSQVQSYPAISHSELGVLQFPTLPMTCSEYVESEASIHSVHRQRFHSPCSTYQSSDAGIASDMSDGLPTTWSSPDLNDIAASAPVSTAGDSNWMFDSSYVEFFTSNPGATSYPSVETGQEFDMYDVDLPLGFTKALPEQGYPPMVYDQAKYYDANARTSQKTLGVPGIDQRRNFPVIKRRRLQTSRTSTSPQPPTNRINKRKSVTTRSLNTSSAGESVAASRERTSSGPTRSFVCPFAPYGCLSTFATKNEWKRHTLTQHMRMGFWRCDQCSQAGHRPNDFNRKDLFVQHVRRMHPESYTESNQRASAAINSSVRNDYEEQALALIARRCYLQLRTPPTRCSCLFCDLDFEGANAWDERIEHIGRHLETAKKRGEEPPDVIEWRPDHELEQWLAREQIIDWHDGEWSFAQDRHC